jgi:hypothetical protein
LAGLIQAVCFTLLQARGGTLGQGYECQGKVGHSADIHSPDHAGLANLRVLQVDRAASQLRFWRLLNSELQIRNSEFDVSLLTSAATKKIFFDTNG